MALESESDRGLGDCDRSTHNDSIPSHCTQTSAKRLTSNHRKDLEASGLSEEQIRKTGHFSADQATAQKLVGVSLPGLIFLYHDPWGQPYRERDGKPFYRMKPDWGKLKTEDSRKCISALKEKVVVPISLVSIPSDRITRLRPYAFDASAPCPTWLNFLAEAMEGDEERVQLIRAIFRYAALPRASDRKAEIEKSFDFFGQKGTGKGTTLDVLTNLVGSENIGSASVDTFKTAVGLGPLLDKDLAIDYDASGFLSNIGNYNKVVSNEPVEVKKLYQDTCTTRLGVVVIRAYNAFIEVPNGSEGLDRRLTIMPFRQQPKTIDTGLAQKLEAELAGIFAWCHSMSASEMKQRLLTAGTIQAVVAMSLERFEANNPEFSFLSEVFPDGKQSLKAGDLYRSYQN